MDTSEFVRTAAVFRLNNPSLKKWIVDKESFNIQVTPQFGSAQTWHFYEVGAIENGDGPFEHKFTKDFAREAAAGCMVKDLVSGDEER
jgi:hypothetical protein